MHRPRTDPQTDPRLDQRSDPRFPIGQFTYPKHANLADVIRAIDRIEHTPNAMRRAVQGLSDPQLDTPYRDGGWTVRKVVHHVPDSHMNAYIRTKLALTQTDPVIRPYDQERWAELNDSQETPIEVSLNLLEAVHDRWVRLLRACDDADFQRPLRHPEVGSLTLGLLILQYGWHGDHHVAHITQLRERKGW